MHEAQLSDGESENCKMDKKLSEMTQEELWQLFPIFLTEHQDCWKDWYEEEEMILKSLLPQTAKLHHIGSTAIRTIRAKPIIDILAEIPRECQMSSMKELLEKKHYNCMSQSSDRISFNKGYTEQGFAERVFHLHVRFIGDNEELYFRDYLNKHPDIAREYEEMKLALWKEYKYNRDGYTNAKSDFVNKYTSISRRKYKEKRQKIDEKP